MTKRRRMRSAEKTLGTSPGTLTYIGDDIQHATRIKRIDYNAETYHIDDKSKLSQCQLPSQQTSLIHWVDVDGIHEPQVVAAIGQRYQLHPLLLEDVVNTDQKPKIDFYDQLTDTSPNPVAGSGPVVFVTLKMLHHHRDQPDVDIEHISLVLGRNFLVSFQEERTRDIFEPVIDRIKASSGKTRRSGPDYLLYALLDLIVDHYLVLTEHVGERMDKLEEMIVKERASQYTLTELYNLKRELAHMRRVINPTRDIIGALLREDSELVKATTQPYLRDLSDHINQTLETLDAYREAVSGLMDVYYSIVNNRMNSVMKTLTIVSAIFIPLTFIVGVYGMNFEFMPELKSPHGYFYTWGIMIAIAIGEIIYFKRRGWM
ncbi:magnesium transporter [Spirosoma oryzae]|uniref:Magnesium transport protein CorA n=1 Tax=Spirosoma oryzae TaxID=1469603 RepID=A0A2T0RJB3_9BACT|nr:magnesium/cobalt transporter CorA [Spirosoma oryzae]PRY21286.1 magnesium transporter [Spirosoma oryzae]